MTVFEARKTNHFKYALGKFSDIGGGVGGDDGSVVGGGVREW